MAFSRLEEDLAFISRLPDEPNEALGLSAAELKGEFDKAGLCLKDYINTVLLPALEGQNGAKSLGLSAIEGLSGADNVQSALEKLIKELRGVSLGSLPEASVGRDKLAPGAVSGEKIADGSVSAEKLAPGAVTAEKIAEGAVEGIKLAPGTVTGDRLADAAVSEGKLAPGAVASSAIADGAVKSAKLYRHSVETDKIAPGAVSWDKIADGAVNSLKISDGAVTAEKLADGAVGLRSVDPWLIAAVKSLSPELIWENASQGSDFSSADISTPNLSGAKALLLVSNFSTGDLTRQAFNFALIDLPNARSFYACFPLETSYNRQVDIYFERVHIGVCSVGGKIRNSMVIPRQLYKFT